MDPDAPSRQNPKAAQWLHWLVINVSGKRIIVTLDLIGYQTWKRTLRARTARFVTREKWEEDSIFL
jgi:hypothetical protein